MHTNASSPTATTGARAIESAVSAAFRGRPEAVRLAVVALIAGGHLLIEDVPGVGKTLLARALARATGLDTTRVQFTPDLLPTDVLGLSVPDSSGEFAFRPGPIFANIVIADEINRAGPKTQSALLEAMEERRVSLDGQTHALPDPFMVVATQNPVELAGTFALPEAQRDRFLLRLSIGYPDAAGELDVLATHGRTSGVEDVPVVSTPGDIVDMIQQADNLHVDEAIGRYVVALVRSTRGHAKVKLGASPRAAIALLRAARANAVVEGRDFTTPDDVQAMATSVLAHRVSVEANSAQVAHNASVGVIEELVAAVPVPGA